jgi:hypothetical protein
MLKVMFCNVLGLSAIGLALPIVAQQQTGSVCGFVQDEAGRPAAGVHVAAIYEGPHSGPYDTAMTDLSGHYCMEHVRPGEYFMSADDPSKGYPGMEALFFAPAADSPRIVISAQFPKQIANWTIPYKAGFLRIHATDRATGKPVLGLGFLAAVRGSEDRRWSSGNWASDSPVLVPPNENVLVRLNADGYRSWPSDDQKGWPVRIPPGEAVDLNVIMDADRPHP